ncbi:MAG TPA: hypothetical protein PLF40_11470 [Kofleriaceae bacterium]|nr:hypothetical protein [Kofleriaceae bacterium]
MTSGNRFRIEERGPAQVALIGVIDENADLTTLPAMAQRGMLQLDLGGVTFINSLGVRDWIRLQAAAQAARVSLELCNVAEPIIHQLNMIIATRGTAKVTSFFAPYACDNCGREDSLIVDAVAHAATLARGQAPAMVCKECGAAMAFNDFPERYLAFLQRD